MDKLVRLRRDVIGGALRAETELMIFTGESLPEGDSNVYTWGTVARGYATKVDPIQILDLGTGSTVYEYEGTQVKGYSESGYKAILKCFTSSGDPSIYLKIPQEHSCFRVICVSCGGYPELNNKELCRGTFN